jgi:ribonuclease HI
MQITCFTDGSCRYNPHGEMGLGFVIEIPDKPVIKYAEFIPEKYGNSSVVAEYKALEALLLKLIEMKQTGTEIVINTDCDLIYKQFNRGAKPRHGFYLETAFEVARLYKRFFNLTINWISRDENIEADTLASGYYKKSIRSKVA